MVIVKPPFDETLGGSKTDFAPAEELALQCVDEHNEQGQLIGRSWLREGLLHGRLERLWPNGKPQLSANYDAGQLDGLLYQFDEHGAPVQMASYVQGRQHGLTHIYARGRCVSEQSFADGVAHGACVTRNDAGQPSATMRFVKGQIEGPATFFFEGQVVRQAHYFGGLLEGEVNDFDRDGSLIQMATYRANVLQGPLRRYWPGGALMEEVMYSEGVPVGPPLRLDAKGRQLDNEEAKPSLLARLEQLVKG
jgi:antitoxin component YwqK of YwqJK toxin-antitoxin module